MRLQSGSCITAIMGLGCSGLATARILRDICTQILVWDDGKDAIKKLTSAQEEGLKVINLASIDWLNVSCLVWSPGIPHTWPEPHPVALSARTAGMSLVCDVELLMQMERAGKYIGVTGTNGKSTTAALLAHIFAVAGKSVVAGGNLGFPAIAFPLLEEGGVYIIELSSYQLELVPSLRLDASVLLNITSDHLERHGGIEGYIAAKRRLFSSLKSDGSAVVGVDDSFSAALYTDLRCRGVSVISVATSIQELPDVLWDNGILFLEDGCAIDLTKVPTLLGQHNGQDAAASFSAARVLGLTIETIVSGIRTFPGLPHRQEFVLSVDDINYINDSKATNVDAVEKAFVCCDVLYWIAGGQAKENSIDVLRPYFPRIGHVFLVGADTFKFVRALDGLVPYTVCGTLPIAVVQAYIMAKLAVSERKEEITILFSPACASFDQFNSFEHRGDIFRDLVKIVAQGGYIS